jgi:single-stranded DNA-binding protein
MHRTLVYVEGDASMSSYQDAEGKTRTSLNLVQREFLLVSSSPRLQLADPFPRKTRGPLAEEASAIDALSIYYSTPAR